MKVKREAWRVLSHLITALALAFILGFSPALVGKLYLVLALNVLAIPLAFVFSFPVWVWYVIVICWVASLINELQTK